MNRYFGVERRNPSTCPMTIEQATRMENRLKNVENGQVTSKSEIRELRSDFKSLEGKLFERLETVSLRFEKSVDKVNSQFEHSTNKFEKCDNSIKDIQIKMAATKGYVVGGVEGTIMGVKVGAVLVVSFIAAAIICIYGFITGKIDIFKIFGGGS